MWKHTVTVQQHFNDIEWRIRGLALTAATFSVGAAGLSVNNGHALAGALILGVGIILWYAFYFVDRYWYHPLLIASVLQGHKIEAKIEECGLPDAALTKAISAGSPIDRPNVIRTFTRKVNRGEKLRSEGKLVWFYRIGFLGLASAAIILGVAGLADAVPVDSPKDSPAIVKIDESAELTERPTIGRQPLSNRSDEAPTPSMTHTQPRDSIAPTSPR
ncbi:hypothetical protein C5O27_15425 [Gordonia alkanivorans]|nr:hypothetical protein C5O27_15425 [Gordonia alkanivorans]